MTKRTRNIVIAVLAAGVVVAIAAVVIGRVTVEPGMPGIMEMIAQGEIPNAARSLETEYHFDNPKGLSALREFSVAVLRKGLHQTDPFERCYVATSLASFGDWSGRAAIDKALDSSNFLVQKAAVQGLAQAGNPEAIAILKRFYDSSGQDGQLMVVQGLSGVKGPQVMDILLSAAKEPNSTLTVWSVDGLGHLGNRGALPYLHRLLATTTNKMIRTETAHAIVLLGDSSPATIKVMEDGLNSNDVQEASEAALDLGDVHDRSVIAVLKRYEANEKTNARVRLAAAVALTRFGDTDGMGLLKTALVDRTYGHYLPPMLDHLDYAVARPVLIGALLSSDPVMRLAATEAVGRGGGEADIVILENSAKRTRDPMELAQIAWSLGRIGRPHCIPVLLAMVQNRSPEVRDTAADALGHTADKLNSHPVK